MGPSKYFKPHQDIQRYSLILFNALKTPLLIYFAVVGNIIMFSAAYVFYFLELNENPNVNSYWDALWWSLCTISTVGYGDIVPVTPMGKLVAAFLIIVGVTFFLSYMAVLVSVMSTLVTHEESQETSQKT